MASVLFALGRAQSLAGDRGGFATLEEALHASTDVRQRAEIALTLGRIHVRAGQPDAAITTVAAAAEELGWGDADLRLQLEAMLITLARFAGSRLELISQRQAMIRDRASTDTQGGRLVAGQLAWSCSARAISVAQTVELARSAVAAGRLIAEARDTPEAWLGPIHMLALADELEEADGHWREALRLAEQHGSSAAFAAASCYRAATAYLRGHLEEAELYARDSLRTTTGALSLLHGIASAHLAQALIDRGAVTEAYELLDPEKLFDQPRSRRLDDADDVRRRPRDDRHRPSVRRSSVAARHRQACPRRRDPQPGVAGMALASRPCDAPAEKSRRGDRACATRSSTSRGSLVRGVRSERLFEPAD